MFFTNPNQDVGAQFRTWWKELPLYSSFIFIITILTSIYSLFNPGYMLFTFCFHPALIFERLSLWQLFTYPYTCLNPLSAIFSLCAFMSICPKKERVLGTFRFIIHFTLQNLITALMFIPLYYFLSYIGVPTNFYFFKMFLSGLWPAIMMNMVLIYNDNGEEIVQFMCFPIQIKRKWYPWALVLFFSLIFGVIFDLLAGIFTGYLCNDYLDLYGKMGWSEISNETAQRWEKKVCCGLNVWGYISVEDSGNELPGLRPVNVVVNRDEPRGVTRSTQPIVPFTGTGYRLGD